MNPRFFLCLIPSALVALLLLTACTPGGSVSIRDSYPGKIVYGMDAEADLESLRDDCADRGGEFDECGSSCAPDAEVCTLECAFVCYVDGGSSSVASSSADAWETYVNEEMGFSLEHPADVRVDEPGGAGEGIRFSVWGPTQATDTELYDGLALSVRKRTLEPTISLRSYAEDQARQLSDVGTILEAVHEESIAGKSGYAFTVDSLGVFTIIFLPAENSDIYEISYIAADPTQQGFADIVEEMLSSIEFSQ